jgi:prolyl oligopeptidase
MRSEVLEVIDSDDRVPTVKRRGDYLYNYWVDAEHPRGRWRRTTLDEYREAIPSWDVIIDVDALAAAEDENWLWQTVDVIDPEYSRALVYLSRGGSDAMVVREFDMATREFVADGFNVSAARNDVSWEDENTVLVGTDFGDGSISAAGFPLVIKRWRRAAHPWRTLRRSSPRPTVTWRRSPASTGGPSPSARYSFAKSTTGIERHWWHVTGNWSASTSRRTHR